MRGGVGERVLLGEGAGPGQGVSGFLAPTVRRPDCAWRGPEPQPVATLTASSSRRGCILQFVFSEACDVSRRVSRCYLFRSVSSWRSRSRMPGEARARLSRGHRLK